MRFNEIGQQLRAYRMESGLRAEEIAARLGVSRAALYRYEKGEVIKLDTVQRMAELLQISPLSLLGIGYEYYSRGAGYFERLRQVEESADQILEVAGPLCYLLTSDTLDGILVQGFTEAAGQAGPDGRAIRALGEQLMGILTARRRTYLARRPTLIAMVTSSAVQRLLREGLMPDLPLPDSVARMMREAALQEVERLTQLVTAEPIGVQLGVIADNEPTGRFTLLRGRDRANLCINPFRVDGHPGAQAGVALVTAADDAVAAHQRVAETCWRNALRGAEAAAHLRGLIAAGPARA